MKINRANWDKIFHNFEEITPVNLIIPGDKLDVSKILRKDIK